MKLVESILTKNPCYNTKRTIVPKGLMLHSVGCAQPSAKVFLNNWNRESYNRACVHGFIDANDGIVYQTLPWNHRGWHAGGSANNTHIGVEMCEPAQIKYTGGANFEVLNQDAAVRSAERTYQAAVELFAQLCVKYKLNPMTDICSHREGHAKGIASNHGDPEHLWKGLKMGYTMDTFRKAVADEVERIKSDEVEETKTDEPTKPVSKEPEDSSFKVRVAVDNLRIRTGPGTENATTGKYTGAGIFTIVEVQNGSGSKAGWGRLKSGAGWISLDYAERI